MGYRTLRACLHDLEATGQLVRIEQEVDPHLEAAEIQRRVFQAGGPAVYFARVKGCHFPMVSNLFGTIDRARLHLSRYARRGSAAGRAEGRSRPAGAAALALRRPAADAVAHAAAARRVAARCWRTRRRSIELPQLQSWPDDGGAFITLPQVYTEDPDQPGLAALEPGHVSRAAFRRPVSAESRKSACTIRSIAASACIMRRPFAAASRCA